jgi:hypothetical protein
VGLIVVDSSEASGGRIKKSLHYEGALSGSSLAIVEISADATDVLLKPVKRKISDLRRELASGKILAGFDIPDLSVSSKIDLIEEKSTGSNVLAQIEVPKAKSTVLVGAHGDHLGVGEVGSSLARADEKGKIHYGADDNASGVAAVLEMAQYFSRPENRKSLKQNLAFAIWSGEEIGILGSSYFAKSQVPAQPLTRPISHSKSSTHERSSDSGMSLKVDTKPIKQETKSLTSPKVTYSAYVNLDMIGRLRDQLLVQGLGSAPEWRALLERAAARVPLAMVGQEDPYLPTDAMALYLAGVPSISLFTGAHSEYHTPRDTAETLNYTGVRLITELGVNLIEQLAGSAKPAVSYRKVEGTRKSIGEGRSFRIYLGTVPDYSQEGAKGVRISGSAKDSPAEAAGLLAGDIIVELDRAKIENLYDYVYALQSMKAGNPVSIIVLRSGERRELSIIPRLKE